MDQAERQAEAARLGAMTAPQPNLQQAPVAAQTETTQENRVKRYTKADVHVNEPGNPYYDPMASRKGWIRTVRPLNRDRNTSTVIVDGSTYTFSMVNGVCCAEVLNPKHYAKILNIGAGYQAYTPQGEEEAQADPSSELPFRRPIGPQSKPEPDNSAQQDRQRKTLHANRQQSEAKAGFADPATA